MVDSIPRGDITSCISKIFESPTEKLALSRLACCELSCFWCHGHSLLLSWYLSMQDK